MVHLGGEEIRIATFGSIGIEPQIEAGTLAEPRPLLGIPNLLHLKNCLRPRALWWTLVSALVVLPLAGWVFAIWMHSRSAPSTVSVKPPEVDAEPITFDYGDNRVVAAAVSPDGHKVAYADNFGISIHSFDGSPDKQLNSEPGLKISHIAWLADGATILASGTDAPSAQHQVWLIGPAGYFRVELEDAGLAEPSPDGTLLAFTRKDGHELWTATIHGDQPKLLLTAADGEEIHFLLWSHNARYLMVSGYKTAGATGEAGDKAVLPPTEAWFYQSVDARAGGSLSKTAGMEIGSGFLAGDGTLHYIHRAPVEGLLSKTDTAEMKIAVDSGTGRLQGAPSIVAEFPAPEARSLSAAQDGAREAVVFTRSALNIVIARLNGDGTSLGERTPLTHALWDAYPHAWTAGGSVLFEQYLHGRTAILSQRPGMEKPEILAEMEFDLFRPQVSPDGRWVLFMAKQDHMKKLYRVPAAGGVPEPIAAAGEIEDYRCPVAGSCVVSEPLGREAFVYYALDPVQGLGKELARTAWRPARIGAWNLSPDGKTIAVADDSSTNPGVKLIPIPADSGTPHLFPSPGHGTVLAPSWSADGKTLYIECRTEEGFSLLYDKLGSEGKGQTGVLATSSSLIYGVPSRDGKSLAMPMEATTTNVWTTRR